VGDDEVMAAVAEATGQLGAHLGGHGYEPRGLAILREAIARRYESRGLPTSADQILVTNGAQQAIDLVVRALVSPLDPVMVECPTYPNALDVLARARVVTVGISTTGWNPDLAISALRQTLPRLAYLIPDFHNPTGHLMPADCRLAIAEAAAASGTHLVIDETFAELALDAVDVPPPFACYDAGGQVISVGSMSKAYWAGLRIGWIRTTASLLSRFQAVRATLDIASPVFEQLLAAWLLDNGHGLLTRRRAALASGRNILMRELRDHFRDWRFGVPTGGLSLWVDLGAPVSTALAQAAEGHRLRLAAGPRFGPNGTLERNLRLPYILGEEDMVEAVRRLEAAKADLEAGWTPGGKVIPIA
jgi:DNA-binding transcriptional MocR family regulator